MIKRLLFTISTIIFITGVTAQNVGINQTGSDPDGSAMLDVSATNKGLLVPRMTKTQKFLIPNPANGLLVYQTDDTVGFWYYEKTQWVPLMRSIVFGTGLTGGLVQGKGEVDIQKTGVVSSTYGDDDNYPIITVNDYGQVTLASHHESWVKWSKEVVWYILMALFMSAFTRIDALMIRNLSPC